MTSERWQHINRLFEQIVDLPSQQQRALLEEACRDDAAMMEQVYAMLVADKSTPSILDAPIEALALIVQESNAEPFENSHVDVYRLIRRIGSGGMGVVYEAERDDGQFKKRVAIKRVKRGMDTDEIVSRFRYERHILASLEHPNIARMLDGGVSDNRPYFVMEYVDGTSITEYADAHCLGLDARLEIFSAVCSAVQYAHQNLIVHRDLKPSNILVTTAGEVKLLDFGIARLLDVDTAQFTTPETLTGRRIMTPAYASPEQLKGEVITTATDVYALGVILYELLTGSRPFSRRTVGIEQYDLPEKPSTAISKYNNSDAHKSHLEAITKVRSSSVNYLKRRLKGDLDKIVLKALQPIPERRYQSAEQFLEDIKRHVSGLPVKAQPDTLGYRTQKFISRHHFGVAVASFLVLLLVGFSIAMAYQQAKTALERDTAEEVASFLESMFDASDPFANERLDTLRVHTLLERGALKVQDGLASQPLVQARMFHIMGRVYGRLGKNEKALPLLQQALETRRRLLAAPHPDVAETLIEWGDIHYALGQYAESAAAFDEAFAMRRALKGNNEDIVAEAMGKHGLALHALGRLDEAEPLFREALTIQQQYLGETHIQIATTMSTLASLLEDKELFDESEALHSASLNIRRRLFDANHPGLAVGLNNMAIFLRNRNRYKEAELLLREAVAIDRATLDPEHPNLITDLNILASVLRGNGDFSAAESIFLEVLALRRKVLGPDHPDVSITLDSYATLLKEMGDYSRAEVHQREALEIARKAFGNKHMAIAITSGKLASILRASGDPEGALPFYRESLMLTEQLLSPEHLNAAVSRSNLGGCLTDLGQFSEAELLFLKSYNVLLESRGLNDRFTQSTVRYLVTLYEAWGKKSKAEEYQLLIEVAQH